MSLNIEIKPDERIIIGETLITNDGHRARSTIEGNTPILRKKDIMLVEEADTPCKKTYLIIQLMYLSQTPREQHELYFQMISDILKAAPSTAPLIDAINNHLLSGAYYKALKQAKALIEYEKELLENEESC
jgi:flagellar protein FlbT